MRLVQVRVGLFIANTSLITLIVCLYKSLGYLSTDYADLRRILNYKKSASGVLTEMYPSQSAKSVDCIGYISVFRVPFCHNETGFYCDSMIADIVELEQPCYGSVMLQPSKKQCWAGLSLKTNLSVIRHVCTASRCTHNKNGESA